MQADSPDDIILNLGVDCWLIQSLRFPSRPSHRCETSSSGLPSRIKVQLFRTTRVLLSYDPVTPK
jgi:hypothetical protein